MSWEELASQSHYQTAMAVKNALLNGEIQEAGHGVEELIEALSRSDKRALRSHLVRLMAHIVKWQAQPEKRSRGWRGSINNARREIREIQEEPPCLNRGVIESMWQACFDAAKEDAEGDMNKEARVDSLSWDEVFEKDYPHEP